MKRLTEKETQHTINAIEEIVTFKGNLIRVYSGTEMTVILLKAELENFGISSMQKFYSFYPRNLRIGIKEL